MNNKKVLKQLNTMVLISVITQFFVLIKNALVASHFGVSAELDAFNLSNRISTFVYSFIGAGLSTVIIPYLKDKNNKKAVDIFISVIYTASFLILILMLLFREQIILISSGSNNSAFLSIASNIFIYTALSGFFYSLTQLAKVALEFNGQFNRQKFIVLFITILSVVLLWLGNNNIYYYAAVVLVTAIISITIHLFFLRKTDFKFNINYDFRNNDFLEMLKLFMPIILSTGVYQISLLIDTMVSARLDVGSISILNYSSSVISMINILLLGNLTSFVYPKLVKKPNEEEQQKALVEYILFLNAIMCLIFVLFYSVGKEGVSILFERGDFSSENTLTVYLCALILAISLPVDGIRDLLYRYFYLNKDTYTPFLNSIMISIINIVISIILSQYIGLYGVVTGTVVASYLSLIFISLRFKKKFQLYFNRRYFLIEIFKIIVVTLLTLIVSIISRSLFMLENIWIGIIVYSTVPLSTFVILLKIFRSKVFKLNL